MFESARLSYFKYTNERNPELTLGFDRQVMPLVYFPGKKEMNPVLVFDGTLHHFPRSAFSEMSRRGNFLQD